MMPITTLAFSAGIDSAILLWQLLKAGQNVRCVYVDYGQRAGAQEWDAAKRIVALARNHLRPGQNLDLACVRVSNFPDSNMSPHDVSSSRDFAHYGPLVMSAVVGHGLSANAQAIACAVNMAAVVEDIGWIFAHLFARLHGNKIALSLPYVDRSKSWILERGREFVDRLSFWHVGPWSCLLDNEHHCGRCRGCMARQNGFRDASMRDYTSYRPSLTSQASTALAAGPEKGLSLSPANAVC